MSPTKLKKIKKKIHNKSTGVGNTKKSVWLMNGSLYVNYIMVRRL